MNRLLVEIGRSPRVAIVRELKRSEGMAVGALAERMGMSYMGVKQHCVELERDGYLDTWRNPRPTGRPELIYRLTHKALELFPADSNALSLSILDAARQLFGPAAPAKLLFLHFRARTEDYLAKIKGDSPVERAKWLARVRDREGCMSEFREDEMVILERHSPIADLLNTYPETESLERDLVARVLGVAVQRTARWTSGLYECRFLISS